MAEGSSALNGKAISMRTRIVAKTTATTLPSVLRTVAAASHLRCCIGRAVEKTRKIWVLFRRRLLKMGIRVSNRLGYLLQSGGAIDNVVPMTTTAAPGFTGNLYLWPGRGLYIGRTADTAPHAHHALQVCIGIDGDVEVEVERSDGTWQEILRSRSILVEPDRRHRLRGTTQPVVLVYLDPEAIHARAILGRVGEHVELDVASVLAPGSALIGGEALSPGEASALCDRVVTALSGLTPQPPAIDGRIERAIATMRRSLETVPRLGELAAASRLSAGRFGHLFREVTGIPMRRYQLWLRLVAALAKLSSGCSLTEAAHVAGFADSAHMTRTFRRMFGIAPSALHRHSRFVQARD